MTARFKYAIPLGVAIAILLILWMSLRLTPSQLPSPLLNKPLPDFKLKELNEQQWVSSHDLTGHITILNIWASWCEACLAEHTQLLKLSQNKQIQIVGLNYKDNSTAAEHWLQNYGNPYSIIGFDHDGQVGFKLGVYGTPETFIIDKQGIIRYKHIGPIDEAVYNKEIKPLIEQLTSEHDYG